MLERILNKISNKNRVTPVMTSGSAQAKAEPEIDKETVEYLERKFGSHLSEIPGTFRKNLTSL